MYRPKLHTMLHFYIEPMGYIAWLNHIEYLYSIFNKTHYTLVDNKGDEDDKRKLKYSS